MAVLPIVRQVTEADNALRFPVAGLEMSRNIVFTSEAPATPATYSQAVKVQEQTRQCLINISAILKTAGSSLDRVASATVILLDEADFAGTTPTIAGRLMSRPAITRDQTL